MNKSREAFEKWYLDRFLDKFVSAEAQLEKRGSDYIDFHAQDTWEAWQEQQKRIDAALKETQHALQYVEADMRGNHEFLKMAMIRTFKSLAQTLKGGEV